MRLFIAIFPPMGIREALASSSAGLRVEGTVRWVRPGNIHLTLKFLGEASEDEVAEISNALEKLTEPHAPLELAPSGFGGFPRMENAKVIWIGAKGDIHPLLSLAKDMETILEPLGFERERRAFSPHFTLGRARRTPVKMEVEREMEIPGFRVGEITLAKSETRREGAVYTPLKTFRLWGTKS